MSEATFGALVSVRVKSASAKENRVFARQHQFEVGSPITFDREDPRVSAMEYLAGALAADLIATFRQVARRERVVVDEIEAVASGELHNALTFLGVVGEVGEPSLKTLAIKCYLGTSATRSDIDRVWSTVLQRSPLYTTFKSAFAIEIDLQIAS